LDSYCARLNNGLSPPLVSFSGWTRPLGKNFLLSTHAKVFCFAFCGFCAWQFCILQAQAHHGALQVNALFDTNQDVVLRLARGLTMDLNCMFFQAGGVFVVTIRVVSAIVSTIVILMTWLN
jgi:hypothetical protein